MPVNWAFPAAQGEPESFLTILGPDLLLQKFFDGSGFLSAQKNLFCNFKIDPRLGVLSRNFFCTRNKLFIPSPPPRLLTTSAGGA